MPVNVTVEEPRARIVRLEPDRDIIASSSDAHNVTDDGVIIVVGRVARAANDVERVAVQVDGVLQTNCATVRSRLHDLEKLHIDPPVRQQHLQGWKFRHSDFVREGKCFPRAQGLTRSRHSGFAAVLGPWGFQRRRR